MDPDQLASSADQDLHRFKKRYKQLQKDQGKQSM